MKKYYEVLDTGESAILEVRQHAGEMVVAYTGNTLLLEESDAEEYLRGGFIQELPSGWKETERKEKTVVNIEDLLAEGSDEDWPDVSVDMWEKQCRAVARTERGRGMSEREVGEVAALLVQPVIGTFCALAFQGMFDEEDEDYE